MILHFQIYINLCSTCRVTMDTMILCNCYVNSARFIPAPAKSSRHRTNPIRVNKSLFKSPYHFHPEFYTLVLKAIVYIKGGERIMRGESSSVNQCSVIALSRGELAFVVDPPEDLEGGDVGHRRRLDDHPVEGGEVLQKPGNMSHICRIRETCFLFCKNPGKMPA